MNNLRQIVIVIIASIWMLSCSTGSKVLLTNDQMKAKLKTHISTLASDEFEGREAGTEGEKKASDYISKEFKKIGLSKKGSSGYLQEFSFTDGASFGSSNQLIINISRYKLDEDFYPLPYSSNGVITGYIARVGYGIIDQQLNRNDYMGTGNVNKKIFLIESGTPDGNNPHGKFGEWTDLRKKIDLAISKGAVAVIFINSDSTQENPKADWNMRTTASSIPVMFVKGDAAKFLKDSVVTNCTMGVEIEKIEKKGHNVIGYIDNKAAHTIVIGAHFDHLGYGDEGSLYRGEKAIHNGADDNASGTGALIELARFAKASGMKNNNYLFIAFSGEEKGLLGSNYFVKHPTIDLKSVSYMLNMDMVGRLKTDEKVLIVNGSGTTPRWKTLLDSVAVDNIKIKDTESGVGPSDHTSFYLQDIPVLHFFSGTHSDYHKPGDDEEKINYDGAVSIIVIIKNILQKTNSSEKLVFTKTKDSDNEDAPKFKVTLGVVPDYAFEGEGMRIDGVTDDRPAAKAGLEPGDVVIQLGEYKVLDMMSYMKALSKFSKGDTTKVKVLRRNQEIERDITF
ncbi:MAG TPA: M28 family peptidase [Bacteroidia bacterium]|nr:M28 family peptidase [Bacteroidia bacterium]